MRKPRKNYTPAEKVVILRRHLIDHVPVSDLCDEYKLSPTLFYLWQKQLFENGAAALERKNASPQAGLLKTIAALRAKLQRKNAVVAELMEEHIQLKKGLGNSDQGLGSPRRPRRHRRLRRTVVAVDRTPGPQVHRLARHRPEQVLRLAGTLRPGQRAQRRDPQRLVARALGEAGDPRLPRPVSPGGLSATGLHEARRRRRRRQPLERLSRPPRRRIDECT